VPKRPGSGEVREWYPSEFSERTIFQSFDDPIDRHYFLMQIAQEAYRARADAQQLLLSERACWQWCMETPAILPALGIEFPDGVDLALPNRLVILLEKRGDFTRAISACLTMMEIESDLIDAFELAGRVSKLRKKLEKAVR